MPAEPFFTNECPFQEVEEEEGSDVEEEEEEEDRPSPATQVDGNKGTHNVYSILVTVI